MNKKYRMLYVSLAIVIAIGCAGDTQLKPGQTKGVFRGNFWGYYERGLSYADAGIYEEAIEDFKQALRYRKDDEWYARTYGVHFIEYFPNRELGRCYYAKGELGTAEEYLQSSVESAPSSKAEFYIEQITQKKLLAEKPDEKPPQLALLWPEHHSDIFINRFDAFLEGELEDDLRVTQLAINDSRINIQPGEKTKFAHHLRGLDEGANPVKLRATDLAGKQSEQEHVVVVDIQGPVPHFKAPRVEQTASGQKVTVVGTVTDDNMLSSVKIGGRELGGSHEKSLTVEETFDIAAADNVIPFVASDLAGNEVIGSLSLAPTPTPAGPTDTIAPNLVSPPDKMVFFTDIGTVEIHAEDNTEIASVEIDGRSVAMSPASQVFTSQRVSLQEGANSLSIRVTDVAGNVTDKQVQITRHTQAVKMIDARMSLAMAELQKEGSEIQVASLVPERLTGAIVERQRFQVNETQTESTDAFLEGKIHETPDSVNIVVKMIDPDTKAVMGIFDAFEQNKSDPTVKFLAAVIAEKMENTFPILEGSVVQAKGGTIVLNFGMEDPLPPMTKCIVFREGETITDPSTGEVLGSLSEELAEVVITQTRQKLVMAKLDTMLLSDVTIAPGDKVITK